MQDTLVVLRRGAEHDKTNTRRFYGLIKPSNSDHVTIENWKTERLDKNETSGYATLDLSEKDDTYKANIYLIKNVTFEKIPENNITDESSAFYGCTTPQDFEVINNPQFTGLRHYGTYV